MRKLLLRARWLVGSESAVTSAEPSEEALTALSMWFAMQTHGAEGQAP